MNIVQKYKTEEQKLRSEVEQECRGGLNKLIKGEYNGVFHFESEYNSFFYTYSRGYICRVNRDDGSIAVVSTGQIPFSKYSINDLLVTAETIDVALKKIPTK